MTKVEREFAKLSAMLDTPEGLRALRKLAGPMRGRIIPMSERLPQVCRVTRKGGLQF